MSSNLDKKNEKSLFGSETIDCTRDTMIGVDIENIERFVSFDLKKNKTFFNRVYTPKEMEYCFSKSNPYPHLAVRFAGKEAVIKLITGFNEKISFKEIEILNDANGVPDVKINNKNLSNIKVIISLSHCGDKAIAFAVGTRIDNNGK